MTEPVAALSLTAYQTSAEVVAEVVQEDATAQLPVVEHITGTKWWLRALGMAIDWFGSGMMVLALAVAATIPVAQILSLGYLLEVSGRVTRTGRLGEAFIGVRRGAIAGIIALALGLLWLPLWFASSLWADAWLIDPSGDLARTWRIVVFVLLGLEGLCVFVVLHVAGRFFHRSAYATARDGALDFIAGMRLPYYFWLGLRGLLGAAAWLIVPVTMLAVASRMSPAAGTPTGLVGGALMVLALIHLPFLQARFAAENRLAAMFELRENRRLFRRAPLAFLFALVVTLLLALPLYLLKIEMIPREAAWLPSMLFVISIFPARLLTGWAVARAERRQENRHWFWRLVSRLAMLPIAATYVAFVYFTQYLSWYGVWSLYEQHAFLLPVPFLGM